MNENLQNNGNNLNYGTKLMSFTNSEKQKVFYESVKLLNNN